MNAIVPSAKLSALGERRDRVGLAAPADLRQDEVVGETEGLADGPRRGHDRSCWRPTAGFRGSRGRRPPRVPPSVRSAPARPRAGYPATGCCRDPRPGISPCWARSCHRHSGDVNPDAVRRVLGKHELADLVAALDDLRQPAASDRWAAGRGQRGRYGAQGDLGAPPMGGRGGRRGLDGRLHGGLVRVRAARPRAARSAGPTAGCRARPVRWSARSRRAVTARRGPRSARRAAARPRSARRPGRRRTAARGGGSGCVAITPDGERTGFAAVARRGRLVVAQGRSYSRVHGNIRPTLWRAEGGAPLREVELPRELFGGESGITVDALVPLPEAFLATGAYIGPDKFVAVHVWRTTDGTDWVRLPPGRAQSSTAAEQLLPRDMAAGTAGSLVVGTAFQVGGGGRLRRRRLVRAGGGPAVAAGRPVDDRPGRRRRPAAADRRGDRLRVRRGGRGAGRRPASSCARPSRRTAAAWSAGGPLPGRPLPGAGRPAADVAPAPGGGAVAGTRPTAGRSCG